MTQAPWFPRHAWVSAMTPRQLALGVLRSLASALKTDFLSFLDSSIPGQELCPLQGRTEILVRAHQSSGDSVAYRSNLAGNSPADDPHGDIEPIARTGQMERLKQCSLIDGSPAEIIGCGTAVHSNSSGSGIKPHARHGCFSPAHRPDVWGFSHRFQTSPSAHF